MIVVQFSIVNAAETGSLNVLGPVQAEHLGGADAWGAILACQAAGLIVGGLAMLRFQPDRLLLVATFGVLLMPPSCSRSGSPRPPGDRRTASPAGFGIEIRRPVRTTTMQQQIPAEKLSRVYSYDALGSWILVPVGLAVVGPIADAVGTSATLSAQRRW